MGVTTRCETKTLAAPSSWLSASLFNMQFVRICMTRHEDVDTTTAAILSVLAEFDPAGTGRVPLSTLLHVLCEVDTPSALTLEEVRHFPPLSTLTLAGSWPARSLVIPSGAETHC